MATVTSLTRTKIEELLSGYDGISFSQEELQALVSQLWTNNGSFGSALDEFKNITLPGLAEDLAANKIAVGDLNDNALPNLQLSLAETDASVQDMLTVDIPSLQEAQANNWTWIDELNTVSLPALYSRLDSNDAALLDLNTTVLPGLSSRLQDLEDNPGGSQFDPTELENALAALQGRFPVEGDDIALHTITANNILADTITAMEIASHTITALEIAADTITANEIAADSITASEIASRTITANEIAADTITANEVAADSITASEIAARTITAEEIKADTLTANEIASKTITAEEIFGGTITALEIKAKTITAGEIKADTLTANEIASKTITAAEIAAGTITALEILSKSITSEQIKAETITSNEIASNSIRASHFESDIILAKQRVAAEGALGQSVELNPGGFFVYGPTKADGSGRDTYISFPTDGGTGEGARPNVISGSLRATTLSVEGNPLTGQAATFRMNSQFEPGSTVSLNDEIVAPVAGANPESVSNVVRAIKGTSDGVTGSMVGGSYHPGNNSVYFLGLEQVGNSSFTNRVYRYSLTDKTVYFVGYVNYPTSASTEYFASGLAVVGGVIYVAWEDTNVQNAYLSSHNLASLSRTAFRTVGSFVGGVGLGHDGTNLWLADFGSASTTEAFRFRSYSTDFSSTGVISTVNTNTKPARSYKDIAYNNFYSLNVGAMDFGAQKFVVTYSNAYDEEVFQPPQISYDMVVFGSTGSQETQNMFTLMQSNERPQLVWIANTPDTSSGYFIGLSQMSENVDISTYSKIKLASVSTSNRGVDWYVGYSFYRPSGTLAEAETTLSPLTRISMRSRWWWKVTLMVGPQGIGSRVYISLTSSVASTRLQATLTAGATSYLGTAYDSTGAASRTASTFTSSTPATIVSQAVAPRNMQVSTTSGSKNITPVGSAIKFYEYMVGRALVGTGLPAGTVIESVTSTTAATISQAATLTSTAVRQIYLPKVEIRGDGVVRVREIERLIITSFEDADLTATNEPPLRVGDINGSHLRIDANEILSLQSPTEMTSLILNSGGTTSLAGGRLFRAPEITNDQGPIQFNVLNGQLVLGGNANFAARLQHPSSHGAIVWQDGDIKITNNSYVNIATNANNTRQVWCDRVSAYRAYNNLSDGSVKDDIVDIPWAMEMFQGLRPRRYKRTDYRKTDARYLMPEYGFVAQEVQKVLPDAVTDMGTGLLGLQYQAIFTVGMAALAELIDEFQAFKHSFEPAPEPEPAE